MKKEEFKKIVEEKGPDFANTTIANVEMEDLKKIDEEEWHLWIWGAEERLDGEELEDFIENGSVSYYFDAEGENTTSTAFNSEGEEILYGEKQMWDNPREAKFDFWANLIKMRGE